MSIVSYHVCVCERECISMCLIFFKSLKQYTNVYRLEIVLHIFETLMWLMCVLLKFNTPSQLACHPSRSFFSPSSQLHTNDSMNRLVVTGPLYDIRVQLHYWFCTQHWNIALFIDIVMPTDCQLLKFSITKDCGNVLRQFAPSTNNIVLLSNHGRESVGREREKSHGPHTNLFQFGFRLDLIELSVNCGMGMYEHIFEMETPIGSNSAYKNHLLKEPKMTQLLQTFR